jgi:hypothetical protein
LCKTKFNEIHKLKEGKDGLNSDDFVVTKVKDVGPPVEHPPLAVFDKCKALKFDGCLTN